MREGKIMLYPYVNEEADMLQVWKITPSLNKSFNEFFKKKYERLNSCVINFTSVEEWLEFTEIFFSFTAEYVTLREYHLFNIIRNDIVLTYKAWRHLKSFPTKGQRTWSNGWTAFRKNIELRNYKLAMYKKSYGGLTQHEFKMSFWAEMTNRLWYHQWNSLWNRARDQRARAAASKSKKSSLKIDLKLISDGEVFFPSIDRELTKKQKNKLSRTWTSIGFNFGFTKMLLRQRDQNIKSLVEDKKIIPVNLITFQKKAPQKAKIKKDEKARLKMHKLKKKKKKSVWD